MVAEMVKKYAKTALWSVFAVLLLFFISLKFFAGGSYYGAALFTSVLTICFLIWQWKTDIRVHEITTFIAVVALLDAVFIFEVGFYTAVIINAFAIALITVISKFVARELQEERRIMTVLFFCEGLFIFLAVYCSRLFFEN